MFLDASAIVAILGRESDAADLAERLRRAPKIYVSALSLYEAALGLARLRGFAITEAAKLVERLIVEIRAELISIDASIGHAAINAFERFGKGRHAASLNMGDCFAYAFAQQLDVPVLCRGNDFLKTDIAIA
jgi:ribonuclease VapC